MKWIALLLLLANLALGGYIYLQKTRPNPDANLIDLQMNAEQIKVIPPPQRPAPQPAACLEWRSFGAAELKRAMAALEPMGLGDRLTSRDVSVEMDWWVYMPPQGSRSNMERKAQELRDLGIEEFRLVTDAGQWQYAIALGAFRTEAAADAFLSRLRDQGVRTAVTGQRNQRVTQTVLTVREPRPDEAAALAELSARFPGTDLKAIDCPR